MEKKDHVCIETSQINCRYWDQKRCHWFCNLRKITRRKKDQEEVCIHTSHRLIVNTRTRKIATDSPI